ncbi:Helix-turn-helix domain-containing protein [Paenibacillus sp. UNCCL117]|uniref:AraC family transcriptional regulator n=1 Tax=unclassified Paenibacillus TaxID=185978 RepID=UPI00088FF18B|nr:MULTISPECIES: AraC family transcriptional regulator [unclassified Paenibacillus]SDC24205.1 Helix-turn-helix domain-containing protein [Paenibacillus sp. cl123]SFW19492.1 Helix-turn-helix domain-containing protein [Paenibacillus sp. UNCCL117]
MAPKMKSRWLQLINRFSGSKRRFYRKSLIMLLIVSAIPGLIAGAVVYGIAGGRLKSELLQLHNAQIEQRAHNIDEQLNNLELMLSHWAFDSKFDYMLNEPDFLRNYEKAWDITKTLLVMQGSNTMTRKVELYLQRSPSLLFSPQYDVILSEALDEVYGGLLESGRTAYWTQKAFEPNQPNEKDLTLVHQIPGGTLQPFGALLIRLDSEKVAAMLKTMTPYNEGEAFVMRDSGEVYASSSGNPGSSGLIGELKEKIAARKDQQGSFFFTWQRATYTVTYGGFSRIADNWVYVSASPITSITSPVVLISKVIIAVSLGTLLLAAMLAWLASRSIYSPIDRLVRVLLNGKTAADGQIDEFTLIERQWQYLHRESSELQTRLSEQLPHVKESFLHQLLQGYLYAYSEEDLLRRMERYRWLVREQQFIIVYVQLNGITSLDGKFKDGDEGLVTFAAVNMIGEIAEEHFGQSDTINFHDLTAAVLLTVPKQEGQLPDLRSFGDELTNTVNRILKMRVTLAVSRSVERIVDVPLAFEEVRQAVGQRSADNENQFIDMEEWLQRESDELSEPQYPFTLEREFIHALRTGREADGDQLLEAILETLTAKGAKEIDVQQGMLHLLGSVQHAVMSSGIQPNRLYKCVNLYEQLSQIREPKLMLAWFRERVIAPFLKELGSRSDSHVKQLIEQAMHYLQERYMKDISLDSCSDHIGTNPFYLSKSFKQVTGKNFIDYLTELRMDKAKELLRESELKINDVAEQVGYQHSYFNRIFKKQEGVTPSKYREMSRAQ